MAQVLIVSNRLPVSVTKENGQLEIKPSLGGLATGLSSYAQNRHNRWIGWPGIASDELTEADKHVITLELAKHNCVPVFLTHKQLDEFYNGYSNSVLWPIFHNLPFKRNPKQEQWWKSYRSVNKLFADTVLSLVRPDSTIWIHDYQLMLLPAMLRAERGQGHIGFFLHIPFPDFKALSKITDAKRLMLGVLGADLVGFHTAGYVDNFMASCQDFSIGAVSANQIVNLGRISRVTNFPMGIDYEKYAQAGKSRAVREAYKKYKRRYRGRKLIIAVDRLDPSKGLLERLKAYREFLERNPRLHRKVVLSMVAAPSRSEVAAYQNLEKSLHALVAQINHKFGNSKWQPVDLIAGLPFEEVTALFQLADVAFIAPLRDGMNLVAKEFVAANRKKGVLILSETAGAAQELREALLVDPKKPDTVIAALNQALSMPRRELRKRLKQMQRQIAANTVHTWAGNFIKALNQPVPGTEIHVRTKTLNSALIARQVSDYKAAASRLLLLDYDGTLAALTADYEEVQPTKDLRALLEKLVIDTANSVVLVSGRSRADLDAWLGDLPLSLVAEHGAYIKKVHRKTWTSTSQSETKWKKVVQPILETYAIKTPGAAVEEKGHSLVWHYRQASPYYAQKNAVTIKRVLKPIIKTYGLEIYNGNKILEIKDPRLNKGDAIQQWFSTSYDFILAIGDDYTDEDMFTALPAQGVSIKVGSGHTKALYRVAGPDAVKHLLRQLMS